MSNREQSRDRGDSGECDGRSVETCRARPPAVSGSFYPRDAEALEDMVRGFLDAVPNDSAAPEGPSPKALIVPHAGYVYSGAVAASAYAEVARGRDGVERVVLLGPSHRVAFEGLAVPSADAFLTPLGAVHVDHGAVLDLMSLPQVRELDAAHDREHSLEVHLPFLQCALGSFDLVPLSVGDASAREVDEVIERVWGGPETLIVVSSDLSHYYDYDTAQRMDAETTRSIERLDPDGLGSESACGRVPTRGLLLAALRHGLTARTVDLRNSGDTAGPRDQVVGYGSYVFT